MTVPDLVRKIKTDHGKKIGASTVRDIEKDKSRNPGIKTVEFIALGLGLDPLEVVGLALNNPVEMEPGYKVSQVAQLWKTYSQVAKDRRPFADDYLQTLIEKFADWRHPHLP